MARERIIMPGGAAAIFCSSRRRQRCACGRPATLLLGHVGKKSAGRLLGGVQHDAVPA